jgi:L-amino acid N-acyltransferase YncA
LLNPFYEHEFVESELFTESPEELAAWMAEREANGFAVWQSESKTVERDRTAYNNAVARVAERNADTNAKHEKRIASKQ